MGMYDSLRDAEGVDWQTKAFECTLHWYDIGDEVPPVETAGVTTYQVEILGFPPAYVPYMDSYATIRDGVLVSVHDARDSGLPLLDYHGDTMTTATNKAAPPTS